MPLAHKRGLTTSLSFVANNGGGGTSRNTDGVNLITHRGSKENSNPNIFERHAGRPSSPSKKQLTIEVEPNEQVNRP